jgi:hypothetical protein
MMTESNTVLRSMHDTGLAAWFGGSLMGAVGLNGAAAKVDNPTERLEVSSAGWDRWAPVNAAAIGAHLAGAAGMLLAQRRDIPLKGLGRQSAAKTALTAAALGATAYARVVGKKLDNAGRVPVEGVTEPTAGTPDGVSSAQRQQKVAQWIVPLSTGVLMVMTALLDERQKSRSGLSGLVSRFTGR